MIWKNFQDQGFRLTEQDIENLTPFIFNIYQNSIKDIKKDLQSVYSKILSGVKPEEYYNTMLKYDRLTKLLDSVTKQYNDYSKQAGKLIGQSGEISAANNFYRMQYTHNWLVSGIDFALIPDDIVQMSVYGSIEAYKKYQDSILEKIYGSANIYMPKYGTLSNLLATSRSKEIAAITQKITQGLLTGKNYRSVAADVSNIIGVFIRDKNGNINATGAMANALRIQRTETTRIMSDAALANTNYARSKGIEVVRIWNATLDNRTRPAHSKLDDKPENKAGVWESQAGTVSGPGNFNSVGQNVNCRCTTFESVNGSKPTLRRGRNPLTGKNEVFDYKSFDDWAKENGLKENKFGKLV
jgi:hypothetical protein